MAVYIYGNLWYNINVIKIEVKIMDLKNDFLKANGISSSRAKKMLTEHDKDAEGNIIIREGKFIISKNSVSEYHYANALVLLIQPGLLNRQDVQGRMALVKSYIHDKYPEHYKNSDAEITMANNFIMPEIAKQFQLEVADYYNVVFEDGEGLKSRANFKEIGRIKEQKIQPNHRYLLTPSFLRNDEELIHLADILENKYESKATKILNAIEEYLKKMRAPETDIKAVKLNFIKQCIFDKFIDFSDEHNLNSGIIIKKEAEGIRARLAPCYDLDFAAGVYNTIDGEIQVRAFFRKSDNGRFDLTDILEQFRSNFEKEYLKEVLLKLDIEQAIEIGEQYGNFKLSDIAKRRYMDFFKIQQADLEKYYMTFEKEKQIEKGEER